MADVVDKETAVLRAVADEISSLPAEVVNEAVIQTASNEEGRSAEIKAKKLEALKHQNELIEEERKEVFGKFETLKEGLIKEMRDGAKSELKHMQQEVDKVTAVSARQSEAPGSRGQTTGCRTRESCRR